jgi:hypothetical protein
MNTKITLTLASWHNLLEHPVAGVNVEDKYHALLKAADNMERVGFITSSEWRQLVRMAGAYMVSATRLGTADEEFYR